MKAFQEQSGVEGAVLEDDSFGSHPLMAVGERKDRQEAKLAAITSIR